MSNTIASNNGNNGIFVQPTGSAVVTGVLSKVTANNNGAGIDVGVSVSTGAGLIITIVDSVASNNAGAGVVAFSVPTFGTTLVLVRNVVASNNTTGLEANGVGAILRVAYSVVTGNITGVFATGFINSYGDNDIDANGTNNTGVLTLIPTH